MASSSRDRTARIWNVASGKELHQLGGFRCPVKAVAFSPNGRLIAIRAVVWNVNTGEKLFTLEGHRYDINGLVFTPDDRYLLTGSVDTTIVFWDMKTGQKTRTLTLN